MFSKTLFALLASLVFASASLACPFCSATGATLSSEIADATFIIIGNAVNARRDPNDFNKSSTDIIIETIVKNDEYLKDKKQLTLPRYIPLDEKTKSQRMIIFCKLHTPSYYTSASAVTGAMLLADPRTVVLDAYRGEQLESNTKLGEYLKGAIASREKPMAERLRYFFEYLDAQEFLISSDAMNEFAYADYKDVRAMAEKLPAKKVLGWLKDPSTSPTRLGLYGLFIGHCGKKEDAAAIRTMLDQPETLQVQGLDGILAAYVMLDPVVGWEYVNQLLKEPEASFQTRYSILRVYRFFWESRQDIVGKDAILQGLLKLVDQPDIGDLPMEDLRKWERWELTDKILSYTKSADHMKAKIVQRSILRFALAAPAEQKAAKEYVEQIRREDPDRVKYVEQTLKDEAPQPKPKGS
ncbi:MAG: hypothetical protein ACRC8S_00955 [Fimbriiglobus sp.]